MGPSSIASASFSSARSGCGVARGGHAHAGHDAQQRQIPHAVVAGAVGAGDARAIEHQRHGLTQQRGIHQRLVEGAVEESRVDRDHRVQPAEREPGRRRERVLLGDADVEGPLGEALGEGVEPGGPGHRGGDGNDVAAAFGGGDEFGGEDRRPVGRRPAGTDRLAGARVDRAARVHLVGLVVLGGLIAHALAGDGVHDHRATEVLRPPQCAFERLPIVAVDGTEVLDAEVGEQHLRADRVLEARLHRMQHRVRGAADLRHLLQLPSAEFEHLLVLRLQPQRGEVVGEAADRRGVGAAVVVDDDDQRAILARGDVVERLPAHAAGERAVADDRDHVPITLPGQLEGLCQSVGVGQRGGGVRGLDPVVLALGARRIAGQAALLAQRVELVTAAGENLVYVGLMAGVEDHGVGGRVEHPVDRQGEFDDAEVRAEVPTGCGDLLNQEVTDLVGEFAQIHGV